MFLFFPVLRRGSFTTCSPIMLQCFYSSPSCDGDQRTSLPSDTIPVSILPRLATGITKGKYNETSVYVSILPRLATGIHTYYIIL